MMSFWSSAAGRLLFFIMVAGGINQNMEQIAQALQQTHEQAAQLAGASSQLRQMARELNTLLAGFRV